MTTGDTQLAEIEKYVHTIFQKDATGHDYYHMKRVARAAKQIAIEEGADAFIAEAAGWLHDVGDRKLFDAPCDAVEELQIFLQRISLTDDQIKQIVEAIRDVAFSKGKVPDSLEGKIVQDADRLDAIGAIGIARTFAFGGAANQLIHWPSEEKPRTAIQHFYDKLLLLKDKMNTDAALRYAESRHQFLENFLKEFLTEWDASF